MKRFVHVLVAMAALLGSAAVQAFGVERFVEGVHYSRAANGAPQPNVVVEFFSFGCPHCAHLEPAVETWLKKKPAGVTFNRVPAAWNPSFQFLGRVYLTLDSLGIADKSMQAVFDHIHKDKKPLQTEEQVAELMKGLGVDKAKFEKAWKDPELDLKLRNAQEMLMRFEVRGVPGFLVAGQYMTSLNMAGSEQELFDVIEFLLTK